MLTNLDFVVVAVYGALMAALALVAHRRASSVDEYFAAGHRLPWWMAAISHHVSGYSAVVFVGFAGKAATSGLSMWTLFAVPCFIAMMIGCVVWAPRWPRLKVMTPVQYLEARYGNSVRFLVALSGIGVKFIDLGIKLFAIAIVVQVCTGWDQMTIIVVSGLITVVYVLIGGLWATVLTDLVQFVVQFVLSAIVVTAVLGAVGGWGAMWDQLPPERANFLNPAAGISLDFWLVYLVVVIFSYNGATWGLAQRFISVGEARDAQKAALLSGFLFLLYPLVIFIPAWAAPLVMPELFDAVTLEPVIDPDQTYVLVARHFLTDLAPGLMGLLVCSMFAATMSMIDSDINALAAVFTKDVYERNARADLSEKVLNTVAKVSTVVIGMAVVATAIAISQADGMGKVFSITVKIFAGILPPVAIPLMFGMIWRRPTARGAILALAGGFATFAVLWPMYPDDFAIYCGAEMVVACLLYFGEGFLSSRGAEKEREVTELFQRLSGEAAALAGEEEETASA